MKDVVFYIVLNIKTTTGFETFGKFYIGNSRKTASNIFKKFSGNKQVDEKDVLLIELMETREGLPLNMMTISCTLDQLAENCKIITREIFKHFNLKIV